MPGAALAGTAGAALEATIGAVLAFGGEPAPEGLVHAATMMTRPMSVATRRIRGWRGVDATVQVLLGSVATVRHQCLRQGGLRGFLRRRTPGRPACAIIRQPCTTGTLGRGVAQLGSAHRSGR
jgi:hypothetical protein